MTAFLANGSRKAPQSEPFEDAAGPVERSLRGLFDKHEAGRARPRPASAATLARRCPGQWRHSDSAGSSPATSTWAVSLAAPSRFSENCSRRSRPSSVLS